MINWLSQWFAIRAHGLSAVSLYVRQFFHLRLKFIKPVFSLLKGLKDPLVGLSMGQTAENLATHFNITRDDMDQYAQRSHQRLSQAITQGHMDNEVTPVYDRSHYYDHDNGVRNDSSLIKLAKLRPVFDRKYGAITAGNSAQVSDGATILILASEKAVKEHNLTVLGQLIDCHWQGLSPDEMGLGPVHAIPPLLDKHHLDISDIDFWEINEAFAAQVLACQKALDDDDYCQNELGRANKVGKIPDERLNMDGGGISLGHPVGASGSRIVLHLLNVLKRHASENAKPLQGIASLCIGGGQGGAILVKSAR